MSRCYTYRDNLLLKAGYIHGCFGYIDVPEPSSEGAGPSQMLSKMNIVSELAAGKGAETVAEVWIGDSK